MAGGDLSIVSAADADIMVTFIVLQKDVVFRGILLDEAAFQHQRLKLAAGDDIFKVPYILHHAVDLGGMLVNAAEVTADAVFQGFCLADVDDLPLFVLHDVDARLQRQFFYLVPQIFQSGIIHPRLSFRC